MYPVPEKPCVSRHLGGSKTEQRTASSILTSSKGLFDPGTAFAVAGIGALGAADVGDSSDARCTSPSKNAYNESRKAFVIFITNSGAIGFCFVCREDDPEADKSTPPAILNELVVMCFWNNRICER